MREKLISQNKSKITPPGSSYHPMYGIWYQIRDRCYNHKHKHYKDYGGRGITMFPEWKDDFQAFVGWIEANLGPRPDGHSLDRIDNSKGYFPDNLRWADAKTQVNNRRDNVLITHNDKTMTLAQWAEVTGIKHETLRLRHKRGDQGDRLFRPVKGQG